MDDGLFGKGTVYVAQTGDSYQGRQMTNVGMMVWQASGLTVYRDGDGRVVSDTAPRAVLWETEPILLSLSAMLMQMRE
jgi:hypothetical protein